MNTVTTEVPVLTAVSSVAPAATAQQAEQAAAPAQEAPKASKTSASSLVDDDDDGVSQEDVQDLEASFGDGAATEATEFEGEATQGGDTEDDQELSLDDLDDLNDEEESSAVVELYKKKCLNCSHLVPWAEKSYKTCHSSNGNEFCPAATIKILTRIPFEDIVPRFLAAEEQNDTARLSTLYAKLGEQEPWKQEAILEAIKRARAAKNAQPAS